MIRTAGALLRRYFDTVWISILALSSTAEFLLAYRHHPAHPRIGRDIGWWSWFDQGHYYAAAVAWSQGNLDPAQHWYPPGYSLLAAPFIGLASVHAFAVVDVACLVISLWLFSCLAGRLAPQIPHARLIGALVFTAVTCFSPLILDSWVVPWTTTGSAPLTYACLLAAIRFIEQPRRPIFAFWAGLAAGAVAAFRPTDILPLLAACALGMLTSGLRRSPRWRTILSAAVAGAVGAALPLGVLTAIYVSLYGIHPSDYVATSEMIGFEWRLIPIRWVTLMLDPRPLFTDGRGLIEAFPWMAAGFAGFAVFLVKPGRRADHIAHATIILAATLHILLYLAYRDLHPDGLFRFRNYHYFKWLMPVLGFYGVLLVHALITRSGSRLRVAAVAILPLILLLPWRADLTLKAPDPKATIAADGRTATFTSGLTSVSDAMLIPARGDWGEIYSGPHELTIDNRPYAYLADYRMFPRPGGFMLTPIRPLPPGTARLTVKAGITLDPTLPLIPAHQRLMLGLPCWLPERLYVCPSIEPIPPPFMALDTPDNGKLTFNGDDEAPFLGQGWSFSQSGGRWTDGSGAQIRMRLKRHDLALAVTIDASPYDPPGSSPIIVRLLANGRQLAGPIPAQGANVAITANLPADLLQTTDTLEFTLVISNPRSPKDYDRTSGDGRRLGLFVRAVRLVPGGT